jgi:hypothetical protein
MSERLRKHYAVLQTLASASARTRRAIIATSSGELIRAIAEVVQNILQGNVHLTSKEREKLGRYRVILRKIASKKTAIRTKKVLLQVGGALPALLIPALSVIASIIGEVIRR